MQTRWIACHRTYGDCYVVESDDDTITAMSAPLADSEWRDEAGNVLDELDLYRADVEALDTPISAADYRFVATQTPNLPLMSYDGA